MEQTYSRSALMLGILGSKQISPRVRHVNANYLMMPQQVHMLLRMLLSLINYLTETEEKLYFSIANILKNDVHTIMTKNMFEDRSHTRITHI